MTEGDAAALRGTRAFADVLALPDLLHTGISTMTMMMVRLVIVIRLSSTTATFAYSYVYNARGMGGDQVVGSGNAINGFGLRAQVDF